MAPIHHWQPSSTMELQVPEPWSSPPGPSYIYSPLPTIPFSQPSPTSHFSSSFCSQTPSPSSNSCFEPSFYIKQETPESTTSPSIKQESPAPLPPSSTGRSCFEDDTMAPYMFEDPYQAGINPYMGAGFDASLLGNISLPYGNAHYVPNGITYPADSLPYDAPMGVSQPWGVADFLPAGTTYGFPTGMSQFPNAVNYVPNVGNNVLPGRVQEPVWDQDSEPAQPAGVDAIIKNREACLPEEALKAAATIREKYPQVPKEVYASFLIPPPKGDRVARNEYADRMREYKIPHGLIIKLGQMDCAEATLRGGLRNKRLPAKQRPRSSDDIWNDQYVVAMLLAVGEVQRRMGIPRCSTHGIAWEEVADEMHKIMGPRSFKFSSIAVSRRYKCQDPFEGNVEKKNKKKAMKKRD